MIIDKRGDSYLLDKKLEVTKENDWQLYEVLEGIEKSIYQLKADRYQFIWRDENMEITKRCLAQFEMK